MSRACAKLESSSSLEHHPTSSVCPYEPPLPINRHSQMTDNTESPPKPLSFSGNMSTSTSIPAAPSPRVAIAEAQTARASSSPSHSGETVYPGGITIPRSSSPSFSVSSSRRASLLSNNDSAGLPQRLPRSPNDPQSFTEAFQEMEIEQEATVNRLLNIIREQRLASPPTGSDAQSIAATVDSASTRNGGRTGASTPMSISRQSSRSARQKSNDALNFRNRSVSRESSVRIPSPSPARSRGGSISASEISGISGGQDRLQAAEAMMLKRENEMLKRRIKELESMVQELKVKITTDTVDHMKEETQG